MGPLSGLTVVDFSRVLAGPFSAMILADLGARVIKVEAPGHGDDSREYTPISESGFSAYFASVNRGKESIVLNLKDPADIKILHRILAKTDIIVENFRPGVMERLGLGWEELHERYPSLIYAAISGFGHTGPYSARAAYDMIVQAMGGIMSITGYEGGSPVRVGTSIGDLTAGLYGVIGILAAVYDRRTTGKGRKIDISMMDCQIAFLENAIARYTVTGEVPAPLGALHPSISPFGGYRTRNGYIIIAAGNDSLFAKLADVIDAPHLKERAEFSSNPKRVANKFLLRDELEKALSLKDTAEWLSLIDGVGVPCAPIHNVADVVSDPHVESRNMIVETHDENQGTLKMAGNPIKISGFEDLKVMPKAPELDEDREKILNFF